MITATLHERICALMKDGESRTVSEVMLGVDAPGSSTRQCLQALEIEGSLKVVRDPVTQLRVYVWNDA